MRDNVKLDVAIEIVSSKLAEALKKQVYLGNQDVINMLTTKK